MAWKNVSGVQETYFDELPKSYFLDGLKKIICCTIKFPPFEKSWYEEAELEALLDQDSCHTQEEQYHRQYFE